MREAQAVTLAELLKQYRVRARLSQEELSERARLSVRAISDLERGLKQRPRNATVRLLVAALGLSEPEQAVFEAAAHGDGQSLVPGAVHAHNLPAQLTSFVGRATEIAALGELLLRPDVRLLTLTGAGGAGKTRLAVRVAEEVLPRFVDGVRFVDLSPIADPGLVSLAIAQALRVQEADSPSLLDALALHLRDRRMLLVLDNFEQVVLAAPAATQLLAACPGLKVLVTSRVTLRVRGEQVYPVPPLTRPDPTQPVSAQQLGQYESVQLFLVRAQAMKPEFQITNDNAPALAEICRQLDGLPLAIELAAARAKLLPPHILLERLAHPLQVLTRGPRDLPERQQTLRAAIGWSYALLSAVEQRLFGRLAVFVGGCTMEAIAAVWGDTAHAGNAEQEPGAGAYADGDRGEHDAMDPRSLADPLPSLLDQVASLVDKSLLRADEAGRELRFTMLELIRGFALGQLELSGEAETLRQRHAAYYLRLAERLELAAMGPHQAAAMDALEQDHDNLGVALAWSRGQADDAELGLRLAAALWWSWGQRGYVREGRRWLEDALTAPAARAPTRARAKALYRAGILAWYQGEHAHAVALSNESLRLAQALGDTQGVGWTLHNLGRVAFLQGDYRQAAPLLEESLARFREVGDTWGTPWSLDVLGQVVMAQGDTARAVVLWEESLRLRQQIGDVQGIPWTLNNLGDVAAAQGDYVRARALLEESLARVREQGIKRPIPWVLDNLGQVAAAQGDYARAWMLLDESLTLLRERGEKTGVAQVLSHQGGVALDQGDHPRAAMLLAESLALSRDLGAKHSIARVLQQFGRVAQIQGDDVRAARLVAAGEALREALGASLRPTVRMQHETVRAATRARMGETAWAAAWAAGQSMLPEQAIAYALADEPDP